MNENSLPLLFGTDPEMFACYERSGKIYTLPPFFFREILGVPASDDKKHPIFLKGDGFIFHEDGAAFEMSIRPSHNPDDLFFKIKECAELAEKTIISHFPEHCMPALQFLPTVGFEVKRWKEMAEASGPEFVEKFQMSTMFGCDPDFDAFNTQVKQRTVSADKHPERYGGGHIHISGSKFLKEDPIKAIKCLAMTAGLFAITNSDVPTLEKARTYLYGKPGKFRIQNYGDDNKYGKDYQIGIEYRTPSNTWTKTLEATRGIFQWAEIGIRNLLETSLGDTLIEEIAESSAKAILACDQKTAQELLDFVAQKV